MDKSKDSKRTWLVIIIVLILVAAVGLYFWQIRGGKLSVLPDASSSDHLVAVETDSGIYVVNKDQKQGIYRMEKVELPAKNPTLGWWISGQRLLILDGKTTDVHTGDLHLDCKLCSELWILKRDKNQWSVEKNITLPAELVCTEVPGQKADWCALLFPPEGKSFNKDDFGNYSGEGEEAGRVCLLDLDEEKQQNIELEGKPLSMDIYNFQSTAFYYTPQDELLYTDSQKLYRGKPDNKGFKLTAIKEVGGQDSMISELGYCPNTQSILISLLTKDGSQDYFAIDSGKEPRLLLHAEDTIPGSLGYVDNIETIGDSAWFFCYTSGNVQGHPGGSWLVDIASGETQYMGRFYYHTINRERNTFLCWDKRWEEPSYYPPQHVIKQLKGNKIDKEYNVPGWFDDIKMCSISGQEYFVGIRQNDLGNRKIRYEIYVYDPVQGTLQFLSDEVKGVE